jgi:hypothetical protein
MRILPIIVILLLHIPGFGQLQIPELSPAGTVVQNVGFTTISIYYERPAVRGRTEDYIFGTLVPWGKVWRTGAGNCTTVAFNTDVIINGKTVAKGKYALFTIPEKEKWTIILNTDTLAYGAYRYDQKKDVVRMESKVTRTNRFYESLTIDVDVIPNDAKIYISWLNTQVAFDVSTGLDKQIMSFIQDNLILRDNDNPDNYEAAIEYYLWHGRSDDTKQIMNFANKGIALKDDRYWYYWKVEHLMKEKKYEEANAAAQGGINAIQKSSESPERKKELISDFEKYKAEIKNLKLKK